MEGLAGLRDAQGKFKHLAGDLGHSRLPVVILMEFLFLLICILNECY